MNDNDIRLIVNKQREFFNTGVTFEIKFRIHQLKKLYEAICNNEAKIKSALKDDLGKSDYESSMCEIGLVLSEISYMIKHVKKFSKVEKVPTPISQFCAKSMKIHTPLGSVLIISPWNYPFLLALDPLVDAIAAGNTAIIKTSELSPHTSEVIKDIISHYFKEEYISVVNGGVEESTILLKEKFDLVFFTGSQKVGKIVLQNCAETLTPAVLELGGKSPCIVDKDVDINLAAKRIVFGKYLNCGQTCVAPDYVLCDEIIKDKLIDSLKKEIVIQYGTNPISNEDYGKMINERHFNRLIKLMDEKKIIFGGKTDLNLLKIEPTLVDNVVWDDLLMQEEIFGPILPILTYRDIEDVYRLLIDKPKPLALYIFSNNKDHISFILNRCSFGGGCVNDCVIHLATSEMGFGGVGESGMGSYHGKEGFDTFSHIKSIIDKKTWIDLPMRYQPYNRKKYERIIKRFQK